MALPRTCARTRSSAGAPGSEGLASARSMRRRHSAFWSAGAGVCLGKVRADAGVSALSFPPRVWSGVSLQPTANMRIRRFTIALPLSMRHIQPTLQQRPPAGSDSGAQTAPRHRSRRAVNAQPRFDTQSMGGKVCAQRRNRRRGGKQSPTSVEAGAAGSRSEPRTVVGVGAPTTRRLSGPNDTIN